MPFQIIRNDITKMHADAIVNTANPRPIVGSGTDFAIYKAAGWTKLLAERQKIGRIERGQAAITPAFKLNAKYIIHTVGPHWKGGQENESALLRSCYENSLRLAREYGCESIAFPMISTGNYGFPKDVALQIVLSVITKFLAEEDMQIYLVVFDKHSTRLSEKLFERIEAKIDDSYAKEMAEREYFDMPSAPSVFPSVGSAFSSFHDESTAPLPADEMESLFEEAEASESYDYYETEETLDGSDDFETDDWETTDTDLAADGGGEDDLSSVFAKYGYSVAKKKASAPDLMPKPMAKPEPVHFSSQAPVSHASISQVTSPYRKASAKDFQPNSAFITRLLNQQHETFHQMLFRLIDEKGISGPTLYKKANINKKLYSKIKNNPDYQPGKKTIFALALALELNLDQAIDLLSRAGYAFSPTSSLDRIVRCCFEEKFYNLYEIECLLYDLLEDTLTA
ncbi:MAG: macro domain-containing protein [Dorea sp.]|nr:macro domain-containing protein [Dorea sp.]